MVDEVWQALYNNDFVGGSVSPADARPARWTTVDGEEAIHYRNQFSWGWNRDRVKATTSPLGRDVSALIIYGANDKIAMHDISTDLPIKFNVEDLYKAIPGDFKLLFQIESTGHSLLWEEQRHKVYELSGATKCERRALGIALGSV